MTDKKLPDKRTIEKILRENGLSNRQAKKLVAGGYPLLVSEEQLLIDEVQELKELLSGLKRHNV